MRVLSIVHQRDAGPGVFAEAAAERGNELDTWVPSERPAPEFDGFAAALVFGGSMHADQESANPWLRPEKEMLRSLLDRGTPVLGVCLGSQLLAEAAGGTARRAPQPEIGWRGIDLDRQAAGDPLLGRLPGRFEGFEWHSYEFTLPPGATPLARSEVCLQAYRIDAAGDSGVPSWGIQFHAEVTAETLGHWLDDYRADSDALRIRIDAERIREESRARIVEWNELGRGICSRFLEVATARAT
jgi:GMP synthase (glutamine-hydrolysing)